MPPEQVIPVLSRRQKLILVALLVLSMAATSAVLFGPARGLREDIGYVQTDLHATRGGIGATLEGGLAAHVGRGVRAAAHHEDLPRDPAAGA